MQFPGKKLSTYRLPPLVLDLVPPSGNPGSDNATGSKGCTQQKSECIKCPKIIDGQTNKKRQQRQRNITVNKTRHGLISNLFNSIKSKTVECSTWQSTIRNLRLPRPNPRASFLFLLFFLAVSGPFYLTLKTHDGEESMKFSVSYLAEVEFEFTTWAWVQGHCWNSNWQWPPLPIFIPAVANPVFYSLFMYANEWQEK